MQTKDFTAKVKAAGETDGLGEGQFEAIVSAFNNIDSVGDVVMPGAFTEDLQRWKDSGDPIPVIWAHDWSDVFSHIGHVVQAEETEAGLKVLCQLDMENAKAVQVFRLLKGRRVKQFSFAYDIEEAAWAERGDREVLELRKLKIHEVGPCLVGANQETELLSAKARDFAEKVARGFQSGRPMSQKNLDELAEVKTALLTAVEGVESVLAAATVEPEKEKGQAKSRLDEWLEKLSEVGGSAKKSKEKRDPERVEHPELHQVVERMKRSCMGGIGAGLSVDQVVKAERWVREIQKDTDSVGKEDAEKFVGLVKSQLEKVISGATTNREAAAGAQAVFAYYEKVFETGRTAEGGPHMLYKLYSASDELLYIGITDRGPARLAEHHRTKSWFSRVYRVEFERYASRSDSAARERDLIKSQHPTHNVQHRE